MTCCDWHRVGTHSRTPSAGKDAVEVVVSGHLPASRFFSSPPGALRLHSHLPKTAFSPVCHPHALWGGAVKSLVLRGGWGWAVPLPRWKCLESLLILWDQNFVLYERSFKLLESLKLFYWNI